MSDKRAGLKLGNAAGEIACTECERPARVKRRTCSQHCQRIRNSNRMREMHAEGRMPHRGMGQQARSAMAERMRINNPMRRPGVAQKASATKKGRKNPYYRLTPEGLAKRQKHMRERNPMADPETRARAYATMSTVMGPNKFEQQIKEFIQRHALPFRYVGNRAYWIGPCASGKCRNPDFVHTGGEQWVILANGSYWHPQDRHAVQMQDYHSMGYRAFVIWYKKKAEIKPTTAAEIKSFFGIP